MNEAARLAHNTLRLGELHPVFTARVSAIIVELEVRGLRPHIQDGWRSPVDQIKAFESGHSKLKLGFHNLTAGDGRPDSLKVGWDPTHIQPADVTLAEAKQGVRPR